MQQQLSMLKWGRMIATCMPVLLTRHPCAQKSYLFLLRVIFLFL
uniref:Alternative protein RCAN2 n=1 Tax=Homo sapiens TaxID=9606 RepID=L0R6N1_HUMAN|nr:alternative protein RCAN2 [Homo sapiens]